MIKTASMALLTNSSFPISKCIGRANNSIIMNGKDYRYVVSFQYGKNGTSYLSPNQMNMSQVGMFRFYQLFYILCRFLIIEIIDNVFYRLKQSCSCLFRFGKVFLMR